MINAPYEDYHELYMEWLEDHIEVCYDRYRAFRDHRPEYAKQQKRDGEMYDAAYSQYAFLTGGRERYVKFLERMIEEYIKVECES